MYSVEQQPFGDSQFIMPRGCYLDPSLMSSGVTAFAARLSDHTFHLKSELCQVIVAVIPCT